MDVDDSPGRCRCGGSAARRHVPNWRRIYDVDVDLSKLTAVLASRLAAIVPDGFHVTASEGMLWYSDGEGTAPGQAGSHHQLGTAGTYVRNNFHVFSETDEDRVAGVAAQALDELQDYVSEATHTPWPGRRIQPQAHAQVRDRVLYLWYGPDFDGDVVLACAPVPLALVQPSP